MTSVCLTRYLITRVSENTRSRELFARTVRANNSRQCKTALKLTQTVLSLKSKPGSVQWVHQLSDYCV